MPYIEAKFSCPVSQDKVIKLKSSFGKAIECIPGKNEGWLMVNIEDKKPLFFKGNADGDSAFISVAILGSATRDAYDALTRELTSIVSDITGVNPDRIYISYREALVWGWNGSNF